MNRSRRNSQRGFLLITVLIILGVLAAMALILSSSASSDTSRQAKYAEHVSLDYVTEAGMAHAKWQLRQNSSCTGYSDLPNTAFGDHSYSAVVTPTTNSPVSITATGVLGTAATRSLSQHDIRVDSTPVVLLKQPGPAEAIDAFADSFKPDWNHGAHNLLRVRGGSTERRSLLQFDFSDVPAAAAIRGATLELYVSGKNGSSEVVSVHRVTRPWVEGTKSGGTGTGATWNDYDVGLNWSNAGVDFDAAEISSAAVTAIGGEWASWDVTAIVDAWHSGSYPNYGMTLVAQGTSVNNDFASSDNSNASFHPKLTITYACECGADCSGSTPTASTIILSTRNAASLGGLSFSEADLVEYDPTDDVATLYFDQALFSGIGSDIDAIHVLTNGHLVLSTYANATLGGFSFEKGDLVDYDPVTDTAALMFDGALFSAAGNIDAVHVLDDGHLILSTFGTATLGGLSFGGGDLVEYDPLTDTASLYLDGAVFSTPENINAIHVLPNGNMVLSTLNGNTIGGLSYTDHDSIEYDPVTDTASLYFDGNLITGTAPNVDALHIGGGSGINTNSTSSGTYVDDFEAKSYAGDDGTYHWSTDWLEINESDGHGAGDEVVTIDTGEFRLRVRDNDSGGEGVQREADLSGCTTATLVFDYRREGLDDSDDYITVDASPDGGSTWAELGRFTGPADDSSYLTASYDLTAHMATNSRIRFLTSSSLGHRDELYVDSVNISCSD